MVSKRKHSSYSRIPRSPWPPEGNSKGVTQHTVSVWNNPYVSVILLLSLIPGKQKTFEVHFVCIALSWMRSALIHFFSRAEPNWIVYWIWNWIFIFLWSTREFEKEEKFATNYFDTTIFPSNTAAFPKDWPWKPNTIQVNQVYHQKWNVSEVIRELMFLLPMVFSIFFLGKQIPITVFLPRYPLQKSYSLDLWDIAGKSCKCSKEQKVIMFDWCVNMR